MVVMGTTPKVISLDELKDQVSQLSTDDRWALLRFLVVLLQSNHLTAAVSVVTPPLVTSTITEPDSLDEHPLARYYGCIDDETFVRHSQPELRECEAIL